MKDKLLKETRQLGLILANKFTSTLILPQKETKFSKSYQEIITKWWKPSKTVFKPQIRKKPDLFCYGY